MALSKAKFAQIELSLAFIDGLGLSAIRVLVGRAAEMPCWLQIESKPSLIEADGPRVMFDTVWFPKASHAEMVHQQCLDEFGVMPGAAIELTASQVRDAVVNEAGILGARWQSTEDVVAEAESAIMEIEQHIKALNQAGGLKGLNRAYKQHRKLCISAVVPAVAYSAYLHSFKSKVARLIGQNIAAGVGKFSGIAALKPDPLPEINRREHFESGRAERLNDLPKTGRSYVMPGWTHPHQFPRRAPRR